MANIRLLNITHAALHPKEHLEGSDKWVNWLVDMFAGRKPVMQVAILHCPVCTLAALWRWAHAD